jgi:hypothetical protein
VTREQAEYLSRVRGIPFNPDFHCPTCHGTWETGHYDSCRIGHVIDNAMSPRDSYDLEWGNPAFPITPAERAQSFGGAA